MPELIKLLAEASATLIEALGVLIITGLSLHALAAAALSALRRVARDELFREVRLRLGHGILLGLEFLVAADIIRTVAIEFTWESVAVLGLIVLIRTFLSFTLEVELTGRWPWQHGRDEAR